jgi:hypothetical protein
MPVPSTQRSSDWMPLSVAELNKLQSTKQCSQLTAHYNRCHHIVLTHTLCSGARRAGAKMPCEEHIQCVKRDVHGYCDACRFGEPPASFFLTEKGYRRCHPREKKMGSDS